MGGWLMTATTKRKKTAATRGDAPPNGEFKALASSLRGSMSWLSITVDNYLAEKHGETDAENAARGNRA